MFLKILGNDDQTIIDKDESNIGGYEEIVELPDYEAIEDIGSKYNIPIFKEIVPTNSSSSSMIDVIQEILSNEHPVHIDRLSKLLLNH
ncbi:MAG: hypothetical protein LBC39_05715 [Methanobrevibacter sp.]|jgi:hypothetical protein|nr:hypothetical protein [Candidatus Methanovirga aequatorialis]